MLIKDIDRFFYSNVKNKSYFCRSCCNNFISEKKYDEHSQFCNTNKTMILMPSVKKYLRFYNWQNTIKHNFIMYADIESYMVYNDNKYDHKHLMSGYYLDCVDRRYSKIVQLFDKLEEFLDSLINELDYIEKINKNKLNFKIDMSTFDQKKYDETVICPYCNYKFTEVNRKVIHHNHSLKKNDIIDYICNSCNLKIKKVHELVVLFHNSKGYDNSYIINFFSKIPDVRITCLSENNEKFKMLSFHIKGKKYKIKIIDSLAFLQGKLEDLSKDLNKKLKIVTKKHFKDKFHLIKKKLEYFPYMYLNPDNLHEVNLPKKIPFNNILTMKDITDEVYNEVKLFYQNMLFKNLREYLQCYLTSDITLLADVLNNLRNIIYDQFQLDCVNYISSPSLSKDCAFKYSKCKLEHIKDVDIFNFVKNSIMGGLSNSIMPYTKLDYDNECIVYNDISSQYPYELSRKLPYKDYKFVEEFDEIRYGMDKDYGCIMLCDVKTTDKINNDCLFKQNPMLVSRTLITDKNLSESQLSQVKEKGFNKYNSVGKKFISNLGDDSDVYLNFEMYKMFKESGYEINIKKILEFKQKEIFKEYIEYLYSKKIEYSLQKKKLMEFCIKILLNSFYGSMLTDKIRFREIKICVNKEQLMKLVKQPTFKSYKIVNDQLTIIEMSKHKCIFDSPIMVGSIVLFNSKCNLYNYIYNIIPKIFGRENIIFSMQDTDSIICKIKNCTYKRYLEILRENPHLFGKGMGLIENLIKKILEIISLRSKCYSILTVDNLIQKDKLKRSKGINKHYYEQNHTHEYFRKILLNEMDMKKAGYYKISLKDTKLVTELMIKDDISNFNNKRFIIDNLTSKPHTINL